MTPFRRAELSQIDHRLSKLRLTRGETASFIASIGRAKRDADLARHHRRIESLERLYSITAAEAVFLRAAITARAAVLVQSNPQRPPAHRTVAALDVAQPNSTP
jgi:hypothetical protein